MEKTFSGTVASGTSTYNFPSDHQTTINITVIDPNGNAIPLEFVPFEKFDQEYPDPGALTQAPPTIWTQFGTSFVLGPAAPNTTYTLAMRYLKNPTTISADSNTFDVPDDFAELVTLGMYYRALEADDEPELAERQERKFREKMQQMATRMMVRQSGQAASLGSGRGSNSGWRDPYAWYE